MESTLPAVEKIHEKSYVRAFCNQYRTNLKLSPHILHTVYIQNSRKGTVSNHNGRKTAPLPSRSLKFSWENNTQRTAQDLAFAEQYTKKSTHLHLLPSPSVPWVSLFVFQYLPKYLSIWLLPGLQKASKLSVN